MLNGCRICNNEELHLVLDYGEMPLVNNLNDGEEPETYPLKLVLCPDCGLVQITETVPPEKLFSEYYYFSSQSQTMLEHSKKLVKELSKNLDKYSLVIEIASNDGYLLQYYDVPVLGIEPASNVAEVAIKKAIPTLVEFFSVDLANELRSQGVLADVVHAHNVLAHVADLHGFVEGMKLILKPEGLIVIEVPYLRNLIDGCEFDTVYHEHLCYFSIRPLVKLFKLHDLEIVDLQTLKIHGGSLRLYVKHETDYGNFTERADEVKDKLRELLFRLKKENKRIVAYGAAAKGNVLLKYCGIDSEIIDYVVDSTPAKQGKYMPGLGLRIYHPEKLKEVKPDYILILAWNFADEIMEKESWFGGGFIIPNPLRIC